MPDLHYTVKEESSVIYRGRIWVKAFVVREYRYSDNTHNVQKAAYQVRSKAADKAYALNCKAWEELP